MSLKYYLLVSLLLLAGCTPSSKNKPETSSQREHLPRIAISGIPIVSSTCSPAFRRKEAYHAQTSKEVLTSYPFLAAGSENRKRAEWIPTLTRHALPGGIVNRETYESLVTQPLEM